MTDEPQLGVNRQWLDLQLAKSGESARSISLKLSDGQNYQIWRRVVTGARKCSIGESLQLAEILRVPWHSLVEALGYVIPDLTVPISAEVNDMGQINTLPPGHQGPRVPLPPDAEPGVHALRVNAPQSALAVFQGAVLYYEETEGVRPDAFGRLSVVEIGGHMTRLLGVIERSAQPGRGDVKVWGTDTVVRTNRIISATPVRWIRA